jgi:hypothetical protein
MVGSLLVAIMTGLCAKGPRVSTLAIKGPPGFAAKYDVVRQISLVGRRGLAAELGWVAPFRWCSVLRPVRTRRRQGLLGIGNLSGLTISSVKSAI